MPRPQDATDSAWLSVNQAAEELDITPRAVRHRIVAGTLSATKMGPGTSAYVLDRRDVERAKAAASGAPA